MHVHSSLAIGPHNLTVDNSIQHSVLHLYKYTRECVRAYVSKRAKFSMLQIQTQAGLSLSLQQLATGPMARSSSPVRSKFSAQVHVGPEAQSVSCSAHRVSFQGVKRWRRAVGHPPPSRAGVTEKVLVSLAGIVGSNPVGSMSVCC
jgi:hypothetical protein